MESTPKQYNLIVWSGWDNFSYYTAYNTDTAMCKTSLQKLMLKDSQTPVPSKCAAFYGAQHILIIEPSKIISKYDFEKCVSYLHNSRGNYVGL